MAGDETSRPHGLALVLAGRSVTELMILIFTVVVSISILCTGATIAIIEIKDPATDTTAIVETMTATITTIIGALLGLIAGKSERAASPPPAPPS